MMSYSFMVLFLPMNFPCVYVLEVYGLRMGVILGIVSTAIGLWCRTLINVSFSYALLGNIIMALGQPFLYNAPGKVTSNWFPQKERPLATMIGTQANISGIFLGFLLPGFFVDPYSDATVLTEENKALYKQQILNMLLFVSIFASVVAILVIVTFREKPNEPLWGKKSEQSQDPSESR